MLSETTGFSEDFYTGYILDECTNDALIKKIHRMSYFWREMGIFAGFTWVFWLESVNFEILRFHNIR